MLDRGSEKSARRNGYHKSVRGNLKKKFESDEGRTSINRTHFLSRKKLADKKAEVRPNTSFRREEL